MTAVFAQSGNGFQRAFADLAAVQVDTGHPGLGGEWDKTCCAGRKVAAAKVVTFFREHDDRPAFRSFVCQRGKLRGISKMTLFNAGCRKELRGGPVSQSYRSCFVQQQHVHVARSFDGPSRHRDDVSLNHAVHAGNADCG